MLIQIDTDRRPNEYTEHAIRLMVTEWDREDEVKYHEELGHIVCPDCGQYMPPTWTPCGERNRNVRT